MGNIGHISQLYVVERITNSLYKIKSLNIFKKYTSSFFFYCKRRQFRNIQSNKDVQLFNSPKDISETESISLVSRMRVMYVSD